MVATGSRAEDGGVELGDAKHELTHVSDGHDRLLGHPQHGRASVTVWVLDAPSRKHAVEVDQGETVDEDVGNDVEYLGPPEELVPDDLELVGLEQRALLDDDLLLEIEDGRDPQPVHQFLWVSSRRAGRARVSEGGGRGRKRTGERGGDVEKNREGGVSGSSRGA